jgi:hypothetical protein
MVTVADLYMISETYTVVDPGAMVVVHANTSFADIAVFGSMGFNDLALGHTSKHSTDLKSDTRGFWSIEPTWFAFGRERNPGLLMQTAAKKRSTMT